MLSSPTSQWHFLPVEWMSCLKGFWANPFICSWITLNSSGGGSIQSLSVKVQYATYASTSMRPETYSMCPSPLFPCFTVLCYNLQRSAQHSYEITVHENAPKVSNQAEIREIIWLVRRMSLTQSFRSRYQ